MQKAKDLNINVDTEITKRLAAMQVQSKITDADKFHDFIREQTGMSFEDFKQQVKNQLLTQRVISEEIGSRIAIPEAEKRKYYDEHKTDFVRDEEVFTAEDPDLHRREDARSGGRGGKEGQGPGSRGRARARSSATWRATNSDDLETARNGGEMPPFKRGQLLKQIDDIVFKQKKGYVTDPIRVAGGFRDLPHRGTLRKGTRPLTKRSKTRSTSAWSMPQMNAKVRTYLTTLRQDAFLEIKPGLTWTAARRPAKTPPGKMWRS